MKKIYPYAQAHENHIKHGIVIWRISLQKFKNILLTSQSMPCLATNHLPIHFSINKLSELIYIPTNLTVAERYVACIELTILETNATERGDAYNENYNSS